ncbi:MAG: CPBP family intramembrane glutamic endopeptidase [Bacteroidia bacterium]
MIVLLAGYYFLFRVYDKREITELSLKFLPKELAGGFSLGFVTISLSVFILYLLGNYQVIGITTDHYSMQLFTLLMVAALIEDLFLRGLVVREFENWLGTNPTLIIAMLLETAHVFNENANLFSLFTDLVWGFTMAMLFVYTKRIWLPFFFHVGWNFAQPFYGSSLTGLNDMGTLIQSEFYGHELITGGAVGIEGSVFTVIFLLLIGLSLYFLAKKEGKIIRRSQTTPDL